MLTGPADAPGLCATLSILKIYKDLELERRRRELVNDSSAPIALEQIALTVCYRV